MMTCEITNMVHPEFPCKVCDQHFFGLLTWHDFALFLPQTLQTNWWRLRWMTIHQICLNFSGVGYIVILKLLTHNIFINTTDIIKSKCGIFLFNEMLAKKVVTGISLRKWIKYMILEWKLNGTPASIWINKVKMLWVSIVFHVKKYFFVILLRYILPREVNSANFIRQKLLILVSIFEELYSVNFVWRTNFNKSLLTNVIR